VQAFIQDLANKIRIAAISQVSLKIGPKLSQATQASHTSTKKLIAIGASTGGTEALHHLLSGLSPNMPGMVVVQHMPPVFTAMFAERLSRQTPFTVKEAASGDMIRPNTVLIAPGNFHMRVKRCAEGLKVDISPGDKVNGFCPSVDVLFESVAREAGGETIGILLTGMGYDGAKGLLTMRRKGARTIGQDEKSSVVFGMPKVAFDLGAVEKQASLDQIPRLLCSWL
ncbi:MAG: CheB methylesterase domain-containing protein, partial [Clostridia bacterium]|nr:CheB methylesterase domain-containing protein [Clostridia bacterium]